MNKLQGYLLIIIAGALYGTIPIFATLLAGHDVSTVEQIIFRLLASSIIFLAYFSINKDISPRINTHDLLHFIWFGLVGIALFFGLYMSAAVLTSVSVAVLLLYTQPIFTLILSRLILKRDIGLAGILATFLALSGVAVIFQIWSMSWESFSIGHMFALGSGLCYSIYILFMRKFTQKYKTLVVTFWSFLFGLVWLIILWPIINHLLPYPEVSSLNINLPLEAWLLLIGFTLFPTILAYLLFNHGMRTVEPHRAGVLVLSEPLSAIIMGALILSQPVFLTDIAGGILVLVAFLIITITRDRKA